VSLAPRKAPAGRAGRAAEKGAFEIPNARSPRLSQ